MIRSYLVFILSQHQANKSAHFYEINCHWLICDVSLRRCAFDEVPRDNKEYTHPEILSSRVCKFVKFIVNKIMDLLGSILNSMDKPPSISDKQKALMKS